MLLFGAAPSGRADAEEPVGVVRAQPRRHQKRRHRATVLPSATLEPIEPPPLALSPKDDVVLAAAPPAATTPPAAPPPPLTSATREPSPPASAAPPPSTATFDPDLGPLDLEYSATLRLHLRGPFPRILTLESGETHTRLVIGSGTLRVGLSDELRYRSVSSAVAVHETYETELRPFISSNPALFANTTTALVYAPCLIVPLRSDGAAPAGGYTLKHTGELVITWRSPERKTKASLRQTFEYGDKNFAAPSGSSSEDIDTVPTADAARELNVTTELGLELPTSERNSLDLHLAFTRQGGFGTTTSGADARSIVPEVMSPLLIVRDTLKLSQKSSIMISLEADYNSVSYGQSVDPSGVLDSGGPSSYAVAADLAYRRETERSDLGASVGGSVYSTPALGFETDAQEEVTPNRLVLIPVGSVWLVRRLAEKRVELLVDGALQPKIDRISGKIAPRLRAGAALRWRSTSGLYVAASGELALTLGDGGNVGPDGGSDYLAARGQQFAARGAIGYQNRRWLGVEVGGRYQRLLAEQRGMPAPSTTDRWNLYVAVRFAWKAIK